MASSSQQSTEWVFQVNQGFGMIFSPDDALFYVEADGSIVPSDPQVSSGGVPQGIRDQALAWLATQVESPL